MRTLVVDVATRQVLRDLGALKGLLDHAFSFDGERLFVAPRNGRVSILHLREPAKDMQFSPSVGVLHIARFSPDGTMLVAIIRGERAFLLDAKTGRRLRALESDEQIKLANSDPASETSAKDSGGVDSDSWYGRVYKAVFLHDGRHVLVVRDMLSDPDGMAQTAYVFDVVTGRQVAEMSGHAFGLIQDCRFLVALSLDFASLDILDPESGRVVMTVPSRRPEDVREPSFVSDGHFMLLPVGGPQADTYRLVKVPHGEVVGTIDFGSGMFCDAELTPERSRILTAESQMFGSEDFEWSTGVLVVRDASSGEVLDSITPKDEHRWPRASVGFAGARALGNDRFRAALVDKSHCVYVRVRPERWWGVFWLWHFWFIIALALAVVWSGWGDVRRTRRLERESENSNGPTG